jgi:hypothetical protein
MIDYSTNHNPSLITVNACEAKKLSNDSTVHSHNATICNDNDTFNKDIEVINPAKVGIATTNLADMNDSAWHNGTESTQGNIVSIAMLLIAVAC